jgi:hemolysin activation/secretion protein
MSVLRWKLTDPENADSATNSYTFPRNPSSMTSVFPQRSVSSYSTTAGKVLLYEGATPPKSWQFSGPLLDKDQFVALNAWVYTKKRRIYLDDHFGRRLTVVFTELEVVPKRRVNHYWSHDYTVTALIVNINSTSLVGALGPV